MGKVYKDINIKLSELDNYTVNRGDKNKVLYILDANYIPSLKQTRPKRVTIGYAFNGTEMHPNDRFKDYFGEIWSRVTNEKPIARFKKVGLYAAVNLICKSTQLRNFLNLCLGDSLADAVLDYAMFSIKCHTDATSQFEDRMREEFLFSNTPYSDSWYSDFFNNKFSREAVLNLKKLWAQHCVKDLGVREVWLCIDGSNDDCHSKGVELAEKGHAKSHLNTDIVSFSYAVTEAGLPVTFDIYRGGMVDGKAMQGIINFLTECKIKVKGVTLDRGYCDETCVSFLRNNNIEFEIMLKGNTSGYVNAVEELGEVIKFNTDYLVEDACMFAAQSRFKIFNSSEQQDYITIFYDYVNAAERIADLQKKMFKEKNRLIECIANGEDAPKVAEKYKELLSIEKVGDLSTVVINKEELQKSIQKKGLSGIASSTPETPSQINRRYVCRNSSETQYMFLKTQLGYGAMRVHYTQGLIAKFTVAFVASIIRYQLEQIAVKLGRSTNKILNELNLVNIWSLDNLYRYDRNLNTLQQSIFKELEAENAYTVLDEAVKTANNRILGKTPAPKHRKPGRKVDKSGIIEKKKTRHKPGPKKGYKRGNLNKDGSVRQKPGPKMGSHHRKTGAALESSVQ